MERLPPRSVTRRPCRLMPAGFLFFLVCGCVHLDKNGWLAGPAAAETEVSQVVATWAPEVTHVPDPTKQGMPTPGLAGRVYLFGPDVKCPLVGRGGLTVDLYDDSPLVEGKQPILLEQWRFDKDTLKRIGRRDAIGWGYTVFLPWGTYRPDVMQVHLQLRYDAPDAMPVFNQGSTIVLNRALKENTQLVQRQIRP